MQGRQPIAVAASSEAQPPSHETAPSDSVAIPADGSAHESEAAIEDGKSGGQAGDALTGASNVHAERTIDSPQKATALPEHSEVGPSSGHAETAAPLPAELRVEEPSSSGAYQGADTKLDFNSAANTLWQGFLRILLCWLHIFAGKAVQASENGQLRILKQYK